MYGCEYNNAELANVTLILRHKCKALIKLDTSSELGPLRLRSAQVSWKINEMNQLISLTEDVVLYGWHTNIQNKEALNITLLIAKYHIFSTSSCDFKLAFESFPIRFQHYALICPSSRTLVSHDPLCTFRMLSRKYGTGKL